MVNLIAALYFLNNNIFCILLIIAYLNDAAWRAMCNLLYSTYYMYNMNGILYIYSNQYYNFVPFIFKKKHCAKNLRSPNVCSCLWSAGTDFNELFFYFLKKLKI